MHGFKWSPVGRYGSQPFYTPKPSYCRKKAGTAKKGSPPCSLLQVISAMYQLSGPFGLLPSDPSITWPGKQRVWLDEGRPTFRRHSGGCHHEDLGPPQHRQTLRALAAAMSRTSEHACGQHGLWYVFTILEVEISGRADFENHIAWIPVFLLIANASSTVASSYLMCSIVRALVAPSCSCMFLLSGCRPSCKAAVPGNIRG